MSARCTVAQRHDLERQEVEDEETGESVVIHSCRLCGRWFASSYKKGLRAAEIMGLSTEDVVRCSIPKGMSRS